MNVSETKSWALIQYRVKDVTEDHRLELAAVCSLSEEDAAKEIQQVLRYYHEGQGGFPDVSREMFSIIVHITQSYRIPVMTIRMDQALELVAKRGGGTTALDYGGGGGKDSIIWARSGFQVTYSDFEDLMTPFVKRRFEIRGLGIKMEDVRELSPGRYSLINCMDVLEHVFDFEFSLADIISRLQEGGVLVCWPACYNDWSGSHKAKNCAYNYFFEALMLRAGMRLLRDDRLQGLMIFSKEKVFAQDSAEERAIIRKLLYETSRRITMKRGIKALLKFPARAARAYVEKDPRRREAMLDKAVSDVIDNADVYRLSNHRLVCEKMEDGEPALC